MLTGIIVCLCLLAPLFVIPATQASTAYQCERQLEQLRADTRAARFIGKKAEANKAKEIESIDDALAKLADEKPEAAVGKLKSCLAHVDNYDRQGDLDPSDAEILAQGATDAISCINGITNFDDVAPPTVTLVSPSPDARLFETVELKAEATDDTGVSTVDFLIDGTVVASVTQAPFVYEWDTTTASEGDHVVILRATDQFANVAESSPINVKVKNALPASRRLEIDRETGLITVDEYLKYGVWSVVNGRLLTDRYVSTTPDDGGGTGRLIEFLKVLGEVSPETQACIAGFFEIKPIPAPNKAAGSPVRNAMIPDDGGPGGSEDPCDAADYGIVQSVTLHCSYTTDHFVIHYTESRFDEVDAISTEDDLTGSPSPGENNVPDYLDKAAFSLEQAYETYTAEWQWMGEGSVPGLDYPAPEVPVDVAIFETNNIPGPVDPRGIAVPCGSLPIYLDNDDEEPFYLPRHELFHRFQYEFIKNERFAGCIEPVYTNETVWWWMEATAEWAAHQVTEPIIILHRQRMASGPDDDMFYPFREEPDVYARHLPDLLGSPQEHLFTFNGSREYGAFIFAEYLDARFGRTIIKEIWEQMDVGPTYADDAIETVLARRGQTWKDVMPDFAQEAYLLTMDRFAEADWRKWLEPSEVWATEGDDFGGADNQLGSARPARSRLILEPGETASAGASIKPGGMQYFDVPLPPSDVPGMLQIETSLE